MHESKNVVCEDWRQAELVAWARQLDLHIEEVSSQFSLLDDGSNEEEYRALELVEKALRSSANALRDIRPRS